MADPNFDHDHVAISENKRVSFGGDEHAHVQMIVYDNGMADMDHTLLSYPTKTTTAFTTADAPQVKVKVTSDEKDIPRPISPPAQIEEYRYSEHRTPAVVVSPILPTFKKMESENVENPFRPQQTLYHEVDPIVEAYRQRPFPPSPSHSPVPTHANMAAGSGANSTLNMSTATTATSHSSHWFSKSKQPAPKSANDQEYAKRGSADSGSLMRRGGGRQSSLSEARTDKHPHPNSQLPPQGINGPPPGKAEIIHVEEKRTRRRCGCCSVQ